MLPVLELILRYLALGLAYWAFSLIAFGSPAEIWKLPGWVRWRVHTTACLVIVAIWPWAVWNDIKGLARG